MYNAITGRGYSNLKMLDKNPKLKEICQKCNELKSLNYDLICADCEKKKK
jgi:hypothetical protein